MKQHNFNFGDMVQHPEYGRGVIIAAFDHSVDVVFENNRTVTRTICFAFLSELELIPHTAQSGWISVADRLPEHDESFDGLLGSSKKFYVYAEFVTHWRVMRFHRSRNPDTGEYAWTDNVMYKNSKMILNENSVSHWQPEIFPQPPKASE